MDERYAAIDVIGKGLVIFSAWVCGRLCGVCASVLTPCCRCSHAGIVNVVKDAVDRFSRPIYMVSSPFL